jgi:hypothetical protein
MAGFGDAGEQEERVAVLEVGAGVFRMQLGRLPEASGSFREEAVLEQRPPHGHVGIESLVLRHPRRGARPRPQLPQSSAEARVIRSCFLPSPSPELRHLLQPCRHGGGGGGAGGGGAGGGAGRR